MATQRVILKRCAGDAKSARKWTHSGLKFNAVNTTGQRRSAVDKVHPPPFAQLTAHNLVKAQARTPNTCTKGTGRPAVDHGWSIKVREEGIEKRAINMLLLVLTSRQFVQCIENFIACLILLSVKWPVYLFHLITNSFQWILWISMSSTLYIYKIYKGPIGQWPPTCQ